MVASSVLRAQPNLEGPDRRRTPACGNVSRRRGWVPRTRRGWGDLSPSRLAPQCPMAIPSDPAGASDVASTVLILFTQVHNQIREEIEGLDEASLNWAPGPGTNSIA